MVLFLLLLSLVFFWFVFFWFFFPLTFLFLFFVVVLFVSFFLIFCYVFHSTTRSKAVTAPCSPTVVCGTATAAGAAPGPSFAILASRLVANCSVPGTRDGQRPGSNESVLDYTGLLIIGSMHL